MEYNHVTVITVAKGIQLLEPTIYHLSMTLINTCRCHTLHISTLGVLHILELLSHNKKIV